jgi:hypothetical protein
VNSRKEIIIKKVAKWLLLKLLKETNTKFI